MKYKAKFGNCVEIIDSSVNPDHISILKKQPYMSKLKMVVVKLASSDL